MVAKKYWASPNQKKRPEAAAVTKAMSVKQRGY